MPRLPDPPRPPAGTLAAGKRLWTSILDRYELEEHEMALLVEMVRTVDVLTRLDTTIRAEGVTIDGGESGPKVHPAVVEARQQRQALARLRAALRLPEEDEAGADRRPQRRAVRGAYGPRAVS